MSDEFCIVDTEYGKVRGAKAVSDLDVPYWRFLGIPYAKPPVGNRRFQKALKAEPWDGIQDALQEPPPCAGKNNYVKKFLGTDDCLYLNIYTKNFNPEKPQAVLVYIFGGGFSTGSSSLFVYSPDYLLMHDIVVVIFNYRIGPLGFLSLKDKKLNVPGNAGMKDQVMVLEFVRDNIKNFGGDPNNVTIAGHSSGGTCVVLHCLSESSRGLFHRAIILGPGLVYGQNPQLDWAKRLAVKLGFDEKIEKESEILKFLEGADVLKMAEAASQLVTSEEFQKFGFLFLPFRPTAESYSSDSTFLTKDPLELNENAWNKDVDVLIGGNADEGAFVRNMFKINSVSLPYELQSNFASDKLEEATEKVKQLYFPDASEDEKNWATMFGDMFVWISICRFLKSRQENQIKNMGKGKTFVHKFAVDSPTQNHYRNRHLGLGTKGTHHADELCYFWKNGQGDVPPKDSMEFRAIQAFTSIITKFVETGNPGIPGWEPVNKLPFKALKISNDEVKFEILEESERIFNLWEKLYEEAGVKFC